jgi:DNA-binding NarL/FixJ family response regulator
MTSVSTSSKAAVSVRVVVIEDNALMRAATSGRLRSEPDIDVVGEASEPAEALLRVEEHTPDVVVLDLRLGRSNREGMNIAAEVAQRFPQVRIVVYSSYPGDSERLGAPNIWCYVVKTDPPRSVVEAVRAVAKGDKYRSPGWPRSPESDTAT